MSKCNKAKNPCKICLGPVTQRNGLQCQGACESWVHYNCLNYTPGRIKDIKTGIIKVTCPCPDCKTSMPKEFRTDEPFSCTNMLCPANKPPQCDNMRCPRNAGADGKMPQLPVNCPLGSCGNECKKNAGPLPIYDPRGGSINSCKPMPPQMPGIPSFSTDPCLDNSKCPSGCSGSNMSGDMQMPMRMPMPMPMQMPMPMPMQMPNLPMSMPGGNTGGLPSLSAMEEMNNTIGLLSNQMNQMMAKLRDVTKESGRSGRKSPPGTPPRTKKKQTGCPKPCFCPGNPAKK